ncbi:MAG: murE/murF fusion protein [Bradymonadia bacterium]|jgi:murE/murF fusion protein
MVLEVSSHGAELDRIAGMSFSSVGFTNLTVDHLDFHKSFENYRDAKRLLFTREMTRTISRGGAPSATVFIDDAEGQALAALIRGADFARPVPVCTVSLDGDADLQLRVEGHGGQAGMAVQVSFAGEEHSALVPLVGRHNAANLAVALGMLLQEHPARLGAALASLSTFPGIPGRFELAATRMPGEPLVFVDYAHTPDAVAHASDVVASLGRHPSVVVLGCGGDRDAGKRPDMAAAAISRADELICTSDNPRNESPSAIIEQMLAGVPASKRANVKAIENRSAAIEQAMAGTGVVLIAGKGHETYQEVRGIRVHLDDREEARRALFAREHGTAAGDAPLLAGWSPARVASVAGGELTQRGALRGAGPLVHDSRECTPGCLFVAVVGPSDDGHAYLAQAVAAGARTLLVSQDVSVEADVNVVRVQDTVKAMGLIARGILRESRRRGGPMHTVGVTGSNGKTSVKEMLSAMGGERVIATRGNFNNHIGVPLSVAPLTSSTTLAVLELGANQPTDIDELAAIAEPDVAVLTSIAAAHTEGFGDIEGVRRAKAGMLRHGVAVAVLPADEAGCSVFSAPVKAHGSRVLTFGELGSGADVQWSRPAAWGPVTIRVATEELSASYDVTLSLPGVHHASNLSAAVAAWVGAGLGSLETALARVADLELPDGRLRRSRIGRFDIVDDAYNANPSSVRAALAVFAELRDVQKIVILGDMLELGAEEVALHRAIGADAATQFSHVWAVGERAKDIAYGASAGGASTKWFASATDAGSALVALAGDWAVLLKGSRGVALERAIPVIRSNEEGA